MSVLNEITRLSSAKTAIVDAILSKGATVPSGTKLDGMAPLIKNISQLDVTDSTVTPETLAEGVVAYNANGERIVGTALAISKKAALGESVIGVMILGRE